LKGKIVFTQRMALFLSLVFLIATAQAQGFDWSGKKKEMTSKKAEELYYSARSAYGSADYTKAIDLASEAIKTDPNIAKAYALRGKAKKDMGDVDGAIRDLNRAIALDPKLGEAYFIRAQASEIMGEMDKAAADYKKGCEAGFRDACR